MLLGDHALLEAEHVWHVNLEDANASRPRQAKGAGVEPCAENHHLADTGRARAEQGLVEEPRANRDVRFEERPNVHARGRWS